MNIHIIEKINETLQVIIKCPKADEEVMKLKAHIEAFSGKLRAKDGDRILLVNPLDAFYFEAVDNRTFLYMEKEVFEIKERLYELEELLSQKDFIRTSKSRIVNINRIKSLKPELNRSMTAEMQNGEIISISRHYAKQLRTLLSI